MLGKAAIIVVMGFGSILGYMSFNMNRMATNAVGNMSTYVEATASHNLALAGANVGLAKFYADTTWFGSVTQNLGNTMGGGFTVGVTDMGGNVARLRSVSTYVIPPPNSETLRDTVEVYFNKNRLNSFSMFAWMTQNENGVNWITGDTVWGRVHSNSTITINGRPVFMEKLTTTKNFNAKPGKNPNNGIFKKGYETGVAKVDFPNDLTEIINASTSGGKRYTEKIFVELLPGTAGDNDGKVVVRKSTMTDPSPDTIMVSDTTFNGVILSNDTVRVKGTLDGRLTLASLRDLYVDDNIRYERNPRTTASDDLLGLVAEKNIYVANNPANNNHVEIDACVFSRDGSFAAERYNTRPVSGELRLLGSIVQDTRGPVGTFSGSTIQSGFSKRYRYDERLANPAYRPPFYPGFFAKTYAITNWWESYRVPNIR